MNVHRNAKLTPAGRALLVQRVMSGERQAVVARAFGVSRLTAGKWLQRWRVEGVPGLTDRSSRPRHWPHQLGRGVVRRIEHLRRQRWTSPAIAARLHLSLATVGVVLWRLGLNRLRALESPQPAVRYAKARAGELVHVDTKQLGVIRRIGHRIHGDYQRRGRGGGWEHIHVLVDDATRLAYTELLPGADAVSAAGFLRRAVAWLGRLGVRVERVMTDNAWAYRSRLYQATLQQLGAGHVRTRPYCPRTNGKAERFIQTCLREWRTGVRTGPQHSGRPPCPFSPDATTSSDRTARCSSGRPSLAYSNSVNNVLSNDI